jgi:hypothetical protein
VQSVSPVYFCQPSLRLHLVPPARGQFEPFPQPLPYPIVSPPIFRLSFSSFSNILSYIHPHTPPTTGSASSHANNQNVHNLPTPPATRASTVSCRLIYLSLARLVHLRMYLPPTGPRLSRRSHIQLYYHPSLHELASSSRCSQSRLFGVPAFVLSFLLHIFRPLFSLVGYRMIYYIDIWFFGQLHSLRTNRNPHCKQTQVVPTL